MLKVLGVSASARVDKNTADLLNLALKTLAMKDVQTELIQLASYKILPCQGCDYQRLFHKEKDCPIQDDFPKIWEKMRTADAVIFGVPVYSGTIPALPKILFERSEALEMPSHPQIVGIIINGTYGHLNVLKALAPCVMYYPYFKPIGYVLSIGWQKAVEKERTREEVVKLAENIYNELSARKKCN